MEPTLNDTLRPSTMPSRPSTLDGAGAQTPPAHPHDAATLTVGPPRPPDRTATPALPTPVGLQPARLRAAAAPHHEQATVTVRARHLPEGVLAPACEPAA